MESAFLAEQMPSFAGRRPDDCRDARAPNTLASVVEFPLADVVLMYRSYLAGPVLPGCHCCRTVGFDLLSCHLCDVFPGVFRRVPVDRARDCFREIPGRT